jgi:uncharacterized protein (DUF2267 family)
LTQVKGIIDARLQACRQSSPKEQPMGKTGLDVFDTTLQETNHWLRIMMGELGTDSRRNAFNALRAALHAIRDRIGVDNAAHLGAQLPMLLRGAYYEGWHPAGTPTRERHLGDFIDHVAAGLPKDGRIEPGEAARACFAVMGRCLDSGEMLNLRHVLPHEVRNLLPDAFVG